MKYRVAFRVYPDLISEIFLEYGKYYNKGCINFDHKESDLGYVGDGARYDEYICGNSIKIQK